MSRWERASWRSQRRRRRLAGRAWPKSSRLRTRPRGRLSVFGAIDTLENLRKGGRIGGAAALLGALLSIKPVIEVRDGAVEQESKQRTRAKSLRYLAEKVRAAGPLERLALMNADAADFAGFVDLLEDVPSEHPRVVGDIGPVIATHAGRGAIGVAWARKSLVRLRHINAPMSDRREDGAVNR